MNPIHAFLSATTGQIEPSGRVTERRLSDMRGYYADPDAEAKRITRDDPLLYQVFPLDVPEDEGQVLCGATVIHPGKVGDEYFMTKGHFHENDLSAEVYYTLRGKGYLLMETHNGKAEHALMQPGSVCYIPPGRAHRTVNTGDEPLVFFYAMPGDAGHDYSTIERDGFAEIVVEREGQPVVSRREG